MLAPLHNHVLVPPKGNTACAVSCYLLYTGYMNALHGDHRIIWMPPKMHPVTPVISQVPFHASCIQQMRLLFTLKLLSIIGSLHEKNNHNTDSNLRWH